MGAWLWSTPSTRGMSCSGMSSSMDSTGWRRRRSYRRGRLFGDFSGCLSGQLAWGGPESLRVEGLCLQPFDRWGQSALHEPHRSTEVVAGPHT